MILQLDARIACAVVAGTSGTGKTTFALSFVTALIGKAYIFIFDAEGEFAQRLNLLAAEDAGELAISLEPGKDGQAGVALFDPHTLFPGDLAGAFDWFCQWSFATASALPGRKLLLLDEAWKYCDRNSIPRSLSTCVQTGRKRGLETMFTTQLPHKLNGAILNEVTELVCFYLQEEKSLDYVESRGLSRAEIASLPLGSFVSRNCLTRAELRARLW